MQINQSINWFAQIQYSKGYWTGQSYLFITVVFMCVFLGKYCKAWEIHITQSSYMNAYYY